MNKPVIVLEPNSFCNIAKNWKIWKNVRMNKPVNVLEPNSFCNIANKLLSLFLPCPCSTYLNLI